MRRTPSTEAHLELAPLMFPNGCRIVPGKHLHKYSGGANFLELRYGEVRRISIPRCWVNRPHKELISVFPARIVLVPIEITAGELALHDAPANPIRFKMYIDRTRAPFADR